MLTKHDSLRTIAHFVWTLDTVEQKQSAMHVAYALLGNTPAAIHPALSLDTAELYPGRPPQPLLVEPKSLKHRSMATAEGRASLMHALAHIEWNAINLALDAIWRFPHLPDAYYHDWWRVALEESKHFYWLNHYLNQYTSFSYGDFPAHDGMWEMAVRTHDDVLARMALVPRTLEARGLDACPGMRDKLRQAKDEEAAQIVQAIYEEEIGHVEIGNRWYRYLCEQRQCDPLETYLDLAEKHRAPYLKAPINYEARLQAGFELGELERMQQELRVPLPSQL